MGLFLNKSLVLTGMMGVGKSTIGRLLAKKLNLKFIDIDKIIEKQEKKSITKIFELKGETYFRKLEEKTTIKALKGNISVFALGGGAFINKSVRKEVLKTSCSVWLSLKIELLIKRYNKNKNRPLLNTGNLEKNLKKIYYSRKKIYSLANYKVNCDNVEKFKIVDEIIKMYEKHCS